ncbi:hypothetical protein ACJ6WF_18540 [Streptomyces sp. MMS24-I2-30]|uniref:hypothetical protein n=1 Tax=Streptomyces sp. MMS24-I2-30 TaxID=3351564 RepID=UPI003896D214
MRIRATVAAVSGALALSAFAMPGAHAATADSSYKADTAAVLRAAHSATPGKTAFRAAATAGDAPYALNATFSNFKVAKSVKFGIGGHVVFTASYTMTHGADVDITATDFVTGPYIYRGSFDTPTNMLFGDNPATCKVTSATTAACTGKIDVYPGEGDLANTEAGTWKGAALAIAYNGQDPTSDTFDYSKVGYADQGNLASTLVLHNSMLTADASPEPVKKGRTLTVTGKLTRANWDRSIYQGYAAQPVKLQFRKAGSSTYTTLKTIKTSSTGTLKTTVTASADGYYRYSFAGTTNTAAVSAAGDYVDVR